MVASFTNKIKHIRVFSIFCIVFFLIVFIVLVGMLASRQPTRTDSDIASELVLSNQLAKENKIITQSWYYSTEIRIINTQIISMLLFKLTDNWRMVKFFTSIVCCVLLILSFLFLLWQLNLKKLQKNLFAAAFFLLPASGSIFFMVLADNYYLTHIFFVFMYLGLYFSLLKHTKGNFKFVLYLFFFILTAFFSGLAGPRYMLILIIPVVLASIFYTFSGFTQFPTRIFDLIKILFCSRSLQLSLLGIFPAIIGYGINTAIFPKYFYFQDWNEKLFKEGSDAMTIFIRIICRFFGFANGQFNFSIKVLLAYLFCLTVLLGFCYSVRKFKQNPQVFFRQKKVLYILAALPFVSLAVLLSLAGKIGIQDLLRAVMEIFGFSHGVAFFSFGNVINLFVLVSFGIMIFIVTSLLKAKKSSQSERLFLFCVISSFLFNTFVFLLTQKDVVNRFYLPVVFLFFPLCTLFFLQSTEIKKQTKNKLLAFLTISLIMASIPHYVNHYSQKPDFARLEIVAFLQENHFSFGYAPFWDANALTEYSNGKIETVGLKMSTNRDTSEKTPFEAHAWLSLKKYYENDYKKDEKVFLLLSKADFHRVENAAIVQAGLLIFENERFLIFAYPSNSDFRAQNFLYLESIGANSALWN